MTLSTAILFSLVVQVVGLAAIGGMMKARLDRLEKDFAWLRNFVLTNKAED